MSILGPEDDPIVSTADISPDDVDIERYSPSYAVPTLYPAWFIEHVCYFWDSIGLCLNIRSCRLHATLNSVNHQTPLNFV